jgi:ATP-dependent Clp protease ATP-binding subunit ClpC
LFERYTERSRRAIFFARYEALRRDADAIETSDLVLGLTRDEHKPDCPFSFLYARATEIRKLFGPENLSEAKTVERNLPLTETSRNALAYAEREAERDARYDIDAEHLFRGVLHTCDATALKLNAAGWTLKGARAASETVQKSHPSLRLGVAMRFWHFKRYRRRAFLFVAIFGCVIAILYMHYQK